MQKYENHAQSYPRRAVSVATTNEATYWQDSTGARRLIPIPCGDIRIDLIQQNRLQWFAEARHRFNNGSSWWDFPEAIKEAQEERQQNDPWEDLIRGYIEGGKWSGAFALVWPKGPITTRELTTDWLGLTPAQQGAVSGVRLSKIMRRLGFVPIRLGPERQRAWRKGV